MAGQEELKDMEGNAPELSFYRHIDDGRKYSPKDPQLVFQKNDGSWRIGHYAKGRARQDRGLTQSYFINCEKFPDEVIRNLIKYFVTKADNLREAIEKKEELSKLEQKADSA